MAIISRTEDLEILLTVIDSGSLSAAARILDIQVAKVSRAVSRLEKELDSTLLNRTTRKLELTEEGRIFTEQVRNGLNQLAEAEENIRTVTAHRPRGRCFQHHRQQPARGRIYTASVGRNGQSFRS